MCDSLECGRSGSSAGCGLEESVSGTQAPFGRGLWTRASRLKRIGAWTNFNILEELARRVPEIPGQVREPREVTADFESVPLPDALTRLLG